MKNIALCTESDFDENVRFAVKQFLSFPEYEKLYLINADTIEQKLDRWYREFERTYNCECEEYRKNKDMIYSASNALEEMLYRVDGYEFIFMIEY
jgi:hypothetical protein